MDARSQPTLLIVDDHADSRMLLAELMRGDCRILLAQDGKSALQRAVEMPDISLILLDVTMPDMDGYEVLSRLRADERTAAIPVMFITGQSTEEAEERALRAGAVDYVQKPIHSAIAHARILNQLKLAAQRQELADLSERDELTGIANRRHFDKMYDKAIRHAVRSGESLGIAMIDIDHFKQFNDHYGHSAGDDTLRQVARTLAASVHRSYDVLARYGGEEFVLLLPTATDIASTLEQMRRNVLELGIPHAMTLPIGVVTISCGGVLVEKPTRTDDAPWLLEQADRLLYSAKHNGRNRVMTEQL
ncbi:MAG TPA: diguanylate cyclase [Steroidobacteraceae bacterium]|nr:diguanylate cyclase [Steroidobacteraceae bacterium]